ncbi:flagellar type III secretion system pore protein FliP [Roseibacterium sp. SDUM158016]|uniref:flagellar type III secretion system pore protein FliP n=1 Tax=Roseicyclus sediminis TaxID=2980997 RepID=UPI0021D177C5|nr:flagellar type III secretion system pore protein FliP [Roseibacterium sp. SDUM158016]MCU4654323.1 flagellar type III secretion system pore protein FliP [Roseibacterium sp. SDUM158016]
MLAAVAALVLLVQTASAQDAGGLLDDLAGVLGEAPEGSDERATLSGRIIQLIALTTVLSVAPGLLIMMTSFTRFVIVLAILRSALGLNQTPPNIVLTSMALFMTFFVMQPVFEDAWERGVQPLIENELSEEEAIARIGEPFKIFMFANTRPQDLELFQDIAARADGVEAAPLPDTAEAAAWRSLIPAFMISELRRAFTIGFLIFLPFLAIDLIVASILMSAGMMMLPPVLISLPFKIIFFVLIDGWYMLAGSLVESYAPLISP